MVHGATSMGLLRIEDRVFIGCVVAEWARSENTTFLGPLLQFSEFRVQSRSYVIYGISIVTLSIQIRKRDRCGKRPMLAPKTNSQPRNLNFSLQKSQQTARFELNSTSITPCGR